MREHCLTEIVKDALLKTGCNPGLIQDLDQHATVQIDLNDAPSIYIGTVNDDVIIWSDLCEFHDSIVRQYSEALLQEIMNGFTYGRGQQMVIRESEGLLQMYCNLDESCLSDTSMMANAINAFFESQTRIVEIIRK